MVCKQIEMTPSAERRILLQSGKECGQTEYPRTSALDEAEYLRFQERADNSAKVGTSA
jgi:hypothetical protein